MFSAEMFQERLSDFALDIARFFFGYWTARGVFQNLPNLLPLRAAKVHETEDHTPMILDSTTLTLDHRTVHLDGFAGSRILHLERTVPLGGASLV